MIRGPDRVLWVAHRATRFDLVDSCAWNNLSQVLSLDAEIERFDTSADVGHAARARRQLEEGRSPRSRHTNRRCQIAWHVAGSDS